MLAHHQLDQFIDDYLALLAFAITAIIPSVIATLTSGGPWSVGRRKKRCATF
jgi:hypothetical protein